MSDAVAPVMRTGVNTTAGPLILTDDLRVDLRSALDALEVRNAARFAQAAPDSKNSAQHQRATLLFTRANFNPDCDPVFLVNAFCEFSIINPKYMSSDLLRKVYQGTRSEHRLSGAAIARLRQNTKYVLYVLWSRGKLLLPITFALNKSVPHSEQAQISPELMRFCLSFPAEDSEGSTAFRMVQHAPRWLICTGWHKPEDICMQPQHPSV